MAPAADRPFCCPAARGSSQKKAHKQQMSTSYFFFLSYSLCSKGVVLHLLYVYQIEINMITSMLTNYLEEHRRHIPCCFLAKASEDIVLGLK